MRPGTRCCSTEACAARLLGKWTREGQCWLHDLQLSKNGREAAGDLTYNQRTERIPRCLPAVPMLHQNMYAQSNPFRHESWLLTLAYIKGRAAFYNRTPEMASPVRDPSPATMTKRPSIPMGTLIVIGRVSKIGRVLSGCQQEIAFSAMHVDIVQ